MWKPAVQCLRQAVIPTLLATSGFGQNVPPAAVEALRAIRTSPERMTDEKLRTLQARKPETIATVPASPVRSNDIIDNSDFIAFDGFSTLTPKGAILHTPANLRGNIIKGPHGRLLLWNEFLVRNRARILPFTVTLEEAAGRVAIDPKRLEQAVRGGSIVVAVLNGNPVSVNLPTTGKPESPVPATTASR